MWKLVVSFPSKVSFYTAAKVHIFFNYRHISLKKIHVRYINSDSKVLVWGIIRIANVGIHNINGQFRNVWILLFTFAFEIEGKGIPIRHV